MDWQTIGALATGASIGAAISYLAMRQLQDSEATAKQKSPGVTIHASAGTTAAGSQPQAQATTSGRHAHGGASLRHFETDEILSEHLTRNVQFFGLEAQRRICNSFVVVVGLGVSASSRLGLKRLAALPGQLAPAPDRQEQAMQLPSCRHAASSNALCCPLLGLRRRSCRVLPPA